MLGSEPRGLDGRRNAHRRGLELQQRLEWRERRRLGQQQRLERGGSGGGSGSSSGGSSGAGSGSSSGGSSGSSSGGQTDQQCAAEGGEACNSCCAGNHNSGYATYINTAVGCLCGPSGACQTACSASLCMLMPALPEPGDVCDTCLNDAFEPDAGGTCLEPLEEACMPGSECGAYLECSDGCQ